MNETIDCIFGNAKASELGAKIMKKTIKSQKNIVRVFKIFAAVTAFYIAGLSSCIRMQNEKIEELNAKIKELKLEKGE